MSTASYVEAVGRKQTYVSSFAGPPLDGEGWARRYRVEWGEVVGHRIRRLRQARAWTLLDMTRKVPKPEGGRYSAGYFSRLERGWASPPLYVYIALAQVFGVVPGELLGVEEFDREFSAEERMLLRVAQQIGLEPHEAAARLLSQ